MEDLAINDDIDDVFDEAEAKVAPEVEKVEKPEVEADVKAEDDKGEEEPTSPEQKLVPIAAVKDERAKRQKLEERVKELEAARVEIPDKDLEPELYAEYLETKLSSERIEISREYALEQYEDFPEMEAVFFNLVSSEKDGEGNPVITDQSLYEKFEKAKNPGKFAYEYAKKHSDFLEKSSPEYEAKLKERLKAELEAENDVLDPASLNNLTNAASTESIAVKVEDPYKDDVFDE